MVPAYLNLGAIRHVQGKYPMAVDALSKALALDTAGSKKAGAPGMLGFGLVKLERYAEAIPHLEFEQQESPGNPQAEFALALAYLRTNRVNEAVTRLSGLHEQHGDRREVTALLSEALIEQAERGVRQKNTAQALESYSRVVEIAPALAGIRSALGDLHLASGDYEAALDQFRQELNLAASPATHERVGSTQLTLGKAEEAIPHLRIVKRSQEQAWASFDGRRLSFWSGEDIFGRVGIRGEHADSGQSPLSIGWLVSLRRRARESQRASGGVPRTSKNAA